MKLERFWELSRLEDSAFHDSTNFDLAFFCLQSWHKELQLDGMSSLKLPIAGKNSFETESYFDHVKKKISESKGNFRGVDRFLKACAHKAFFQNVFGP